MSGVRACMCVCKRGEEGEEYDLKSCFRIQISFGKVKRVGTSCDNVGVGIQVTEAVRERTAFRCPGVPSISTMVMALKMGT